MAHALSSRSSVLPLVLVAQGATSYVDQLPAADRAGLVPVDVDLPAGAGTEDLRMLAVELVTTL